jgi:hypothetical protein
LLAALAAAAGCSARDTCERITGVGGTVESKLTDCALGLRLRLGLLDQLEDYQTACVAAAVVCGEGALAPLTAAVDCLERVDPCAGDAAAREAASLELMRCSEELRKTPPASLKSCLRRG